MNQERWTSCRTFVRWGRQIAVDDFGTGYSSLSYLAQFPVDILKVDRAFVRHVGTTSEQAELAKTIIQLGQSLKLLTVAEGIESQSSSRASGPRMSAWARLPVRPPRSSGGD